MEPLFQKISGDGKRAFVSFEFESRRFIGPFHYHPEIELTLITQTSGHRYVGDNIGRFVPGDLVLMGANLPHMYLGDADESGPARAVVLQFMPDCLGRDFLSLDELAQVRHLLKRSRAGLSFQGKIREQAAEALGELTKLEGIDRVAAFLKILQLLASAKNYRMLASPTYAPSLEFFQGERIDKVCKLISDKFQERLTQSEAARAVGLGAAAFSRFFQRATNRSFRGFLNEVRIGHASRLLRETDKTVAEICYDSGYGNLSNFNRQFLKLRGVSPRAYRGR